jgi:hypothetical protein
MHDAHEALAAKIRRRHAHRRRRAIATPEQLAKATATKQKLDDLHAQMKAVLADAADDGDAAE